MKLQEIFERVVVESGQFLLNSGELELNEDNFAILVRATLSVYSRYSPVSHMFYVDMTSVRNFSFTLGNTRWEKFPNGKIPDSVFDCIPVRGAWILPSYYYQYYQYFNFRNHMSAQSDSRIKQPYPFIYRKPKITIGISSFAEVHVLLRQEVRMEEEGGVTKYYVDSIDDLTDSLFFDLLTAKFMKAIGRQRRAFTLSDVSLLLDAPQLVAEGDAMEKDALQLLTDNNKWYLAWG